MSLKKALLGATMLALPLAAQAQPVTGVYIGAGAGVNFLQSTKDTVGRPGVFVGGRPERQSTEIGFEPGFVGVLSIGYGFGNGLRLELEGNFRQNSVNRSDRGGISDGSRGRINSYGPMVNAIYELPLGLVQPYIGAGIGYIWQDAENAGGRTFNFSGDEGAFAFQGIAGVAFPVAAIPGLALTAEYRFLGTTGHEHSTRLGTFDADNYNHSILAGLRYNFGQVARAPVAVVTPPAATARTYLVFFDFDRADLTDRARQIIGEAAQAAPRVQSTRIEVAGHADRSGTPAYNQGLSQRRANNVAAELVRQGVARNNISISAFGETRPLVPTADGVREPQNRRVEIVLR